MLGTLAGVRVKFTRLDEYVKLTKFARRMVLPSV
jgi:hypothetical protein